MATRQLRPPPESVQPRAYGYVCVSTDQQRDSGISLDEQQRKIEARCLENGWHLEHVYVDAGVGARRHSPAGRRAPSSYARCSRPPW